MHEKSVAHAMLVGLFCAVLPIPGQMILSVLLGIPLRANLLLAVALVWISNPLTMGPIAFSAYWIGRFLLKTKTIPFNNVHVFLKNVHLIWEPFLVGSLVLGLILGSLGYVLTRICWKIFK